MLESLSFPIYDKKVPYQMPNGVIINIYELRQHSLVNTLLHLFNVKYVHASTELKFNITEIFWKTIVLYLLSICETRELHFT